MSKHTAQASGAHGGAAQHEGHMHAAADARAKKHTFTNALNLGRLNLAPTTREAETEYRLTFSVDIKLPPDQGLAVSGDLPALGMWTDFSMFPMQRAGGDTWVSARPFVTSNWVFQYKYVVVDQKKELSKWERGVNRLADLEVLPAADAAGAAHRTHGAEYMTKFHEKAMHGGKKTKTVRLDDEWETFTVRFRVHYPENHPNAEMRLVIGDALIRPDGSANRQGDGYRMSAAPQPYDWLRVKYGVPVRPFERSLKLKNEKNNSSGQFYLDDHDHHLWYNYVYTNGATGQQITEREPRNSIQIRDPATYNGYLGRHGTDHWDKVDKVWIVNGRINKADGEFNQHWDCFRVGDTGILLGRCPTNENDVSRACSAGAAAVLCLQTPREQGQRNSTFGRLETLWRHVGLHALVQSEVEDDFEEEYADDLFRACLELDKLLNGVDVERGQQVYVYDTNAVTEAPSLVVAYLALFLKHKDWDDLEALAKFVRQFDKHAMPNLAVVRLLLARNKKFQDEQRERLRAEEEARRKREQDALRNRELQAAQEEAERIRLLRLAEEEQERLRQQRIAYQEAERARLAKQEEEDAERERRRQLAEEEARIQAQRLKDEEAERLRRKQIAEEEAARDAEKNRIRQEAEIHAEKLRLQKLALEAAKEAARIKKIKDDQEEEERQRKIRIAKEEQERIRLERIEYERIEAFRLKKKAEDEEAERLRQQKLALLREEQHRQETLLHEAKQELKMQIEEEKQLQDKAKEFGVEYDLRVESYRDRIDELERQKCAFQEEMSERSRQKKKAEDEEAERRYAIQSVKDETLRILAEREALNNKQKMREKEWEHHNKKLESQFKELESETKKFLSKRIKYIDNENAEAEAKRNKKIYEKKYLNEKLKNTRHKSALLYELKQEDLRRTQELTESMAQEQEYAHRLAELENDDVPENPYDSSKDQIAAFGDPALLGISEEELDEQCDELFKETPIIFTPRKGNKMDEMINLYVQQLDIRIPIVPIKDSLYLIGSHRVSCQLKNDQLILRVGGGFEKFEDYVPQNHRYFQRMLVVHMIKSGESLESVVDNLIIGKKIKNQNDDDLSEQSSSMARNTSASRLRKGRDASPGGTNPWSSTSKRLGTPTRSPGGTIAQSGSLSFRGKASGDRYSVTKTTKTTLTDIRSKNYTSPSREKNRLSQVSGSNLGLGDKN